MDEFTLNPIGGGQGELTGLMVIRAYHASRGEGEKRRKVIVPDSAHGTNPASAAVCGLDVVEVKSRPDGTVDVADLEPLLDDTVAAIMLTNPNTLGIFEKDIPRIASLVHEVGALMYYDGANLNPLLGVARPGDMGFEPIDTSVGRLGVLVCWDQWYPEAARLMALAGAQILIYPTAIGTESSDSPEEQERQRQAWITVQRGHAIANGLPVVSVNRCGHEADPSGATGGITFWGSSFVAGPQGEFLFQAPSQGECSAVVDIDMARSEQVRRWWPFLRDRRIDAYRGLDCRYLV